MVNMARFNNGVREKEMAEIAHRLGMQFVAEEEWSLVERLDDFYLFKRGGRKRILNMMMRKDPLLHEELYVFDYQYTISTGKSAHTYRQTVFFIKSRQLALPEFLMKPESIFHKIGAYLGMQDIDFEEHPEFSNQYLLQSEDETRTRSMMKPEVARFFTVNRDWSMEGIGYYLILYKNNKLLPSNVIRDFYQKGLQLYEWLREEDIL